MAPSGLQIYLGSSIQAMWILGMEFASFLHGLFGTQGYCYSPLSGRWTVGLEGSAISF